MKKILKWLALSAIAIIVVSVIFGNNSSSNTNNSQQTAVDQTTSAEPPIETTANELLKAYKENEISANQKYKDKSIRISATIAAIQADIGDKPLLSLKANDSFSQPQAFLADSAIEKAASLKKGQKVVLLCTGNSEVAGIPMLKDCSIE